MRDYNTVFTGLAGYSLGLEPVGIQTGNATELSWAAIGALAAFMATRAIGSILYGVSPDDPVSIIAAGLLLIGAATLASFIPARRDAKIDPIAALRYE